MLIFRIQVFRHLNYKGLHVAVYLKSLLEMGRGWVSREPQDPPPLATTLNEKAMLDCRIGNCSDRRSSPNVVPRLSVTFVFPAYSKKCHFCRPAVWCLYAEMSRFVFVVNV